MINVALDTGIFRSNPLESSLIKSLERLLQKQKVTLYLPHIVEHERLTQIRQSAVDCHGKAVTAVNGLNRMNISEPLGAEIKKIHDYLHGLEEALSKSMQNSFSDWLDRVDVNRWPLTESAANKAFKLYFTGESPVSSVKNRKDIPDAFIKEALVEIAVKTGELHVVVHDKNLRESMEGHSLISVYESLDDFIRCELIQKEITEIEMFDNLARAIDRLEQVEIQDGGVRTILELKLGEAIMYRTLCGEGIPSNDGEATIQSYGSTEVTDVDFSSAAYLGNGEFHINFSANIFVDLADFSHKCASLKVEARGYTHWFD